MLKVLQTSQLGLESWFPNRCLATAFIPSDSPAEQITREIMGNVPKWLAISFYVLVTIACLSTLVWFLRRFRQHRLGQSIAKQHPQQGEQSDSPPSLTFMQRFWSVVGYLTFHRQLLRDRYAGVAHILLFYGFVILFIGTCLVFLEHDTPLHFFYGRFYLIASLVIDLGGVAFTIGLSMFLYRRMFGKSTRILRRFYVASLIWLLLIISLTGFLLEGARIAIDRPEFEKWSVVGYSIAVALNSVGVTGELAGMWHRVLWGIHAWFCILFFALLPWRFFSHVVYAPLAWSLRSRRPISALRPVLSSLPATSSAASSSTRTGMEAPTDARGEADFRLGATTWPEFSWLDLLQVDACTTCGRCNQVCPANAAGKPLQPREIILGIREGMNQSSDTLEEWISDEAIWSCTTCGACNFVCPVGIEVYDKIIDLRRGKVEKGVPHPKTWERFESLEEVSNPFQRPADSRLNWAAGLSVPVLQEGETCELLYWIGCAGSFDPDGQRVSRAMIQILNHLGVDYRILGKRECCNGDPARRMGEEGLFQVSAQNTLQLLQQHGVQRVLTHCPHCFNVFKNEYPQLAPIEFEVQHHSQFLAECIQSGRLALPVAIDSKITFHDPCYLGRGNGDTVSPRQVLESIPQLKIIEMERHGCQSSCCGAGGGSLWLDVKGDERIENQRTREGAQTGAQFIVTGCPFCKSMFQAGRSSFENELLETADLAELVAKALGIAER